MGRKAVLALLSVFLFSAAVCQAQFGSLLKKGDSQKAVPISTKAPEYSEADKAKMAEIANRPEVQDLIQSAWNDLRKANIEEAYAINATETWGFSDDPLKYGAPSSSRRLYNNPMMQVYINNIGQRLVPKDSPNFYTFRILANPMPDAYALSTGSIYISTGLISMLDSEAQLSYILAHEIAHVELKHKFNRVRSQILEQKLNEEKEASAEKKKALIGLAGALGGGLIGGIAGGGNGAVAGAMLGGVGSYVTASLLVHSGASETAWSIVEENEADELGAKYMLNQGYDVREVPRLYASLGDIIVKDSRVGLSFFGDPRHIKERVGHIREQLKGPLHDQIEALQKSSGLVGSGATFPVLLSAAKRDNGILAMKSDLFAMARQNLEDALAQRSNDPAVHFYLSRVITLTAKTPEERRAAVSHITDAIRLDADRGSIPDLHLEYAISLLTQDNSANRDQIIGELKTYVALYQRDNAGGLPHNMSAIFDYFNLEGESGWYLPPGWYPSTQFSNVGMGLPSVTAPEEVVRKANNSGGAAPASIRTTSTPSHVAPRK